MNALLPGMMGMAVILRIRNLEKQGGPTHDDLRKTMEAADMLGEHGDILLYGGGKPGQCADLFNRTAQAIAVLAFAPGGVEVFGMRFEARLEARLEARPKGRGQSS